MVWRTRSGVCDGLCGGGRRLKVIPAGVEDVYGTTAFR
jgi:hypothetical protein